MREPTTYAEWSECLDALAAGQHDEDVVLAMSLGTVNWASGWAERFSERLFETINIRLKRCADRMDREFSSGFSEVIIVRAMLDTRRTLALLHRIANLPSFPATLRAHVGDEIAKYAKSAQQSLEISAKNDRSGQLGRMIKHSSLLNYVQQTEVLIPQTNSTPDSNSLKPGRAVLQESTKTSLPKRSGKQQKIVAVLMLVGIVVLCVIYFVLHR